MCDFTVLCSNVQYVPEETGLYVKLTEQVAMSSIWVFILIRPSVSMSYKPPFPSLPNDITQSI